MLTGHAGGADGTWSSLAPSKVPHTPLRGHSLGVSLTRGLLEGGLCSSGGGGAWACGLLPAHAIKCCLEELRLRKCHVLKISVTVQV